MKNKTCMICKLGIDMDKQEYVEVKHYEKKDLLRSKGFYHVNCFRDRLNGSNVQRAFQQKAMEVLDKIGSIKLLKGNKEKDKDDEVVYI